MPRKQRNPGLSFSDVSDIFCNDKLDFVLRSKARCTSCKQDRGLDHFHRNRSRKYGIDSLCKDCRRMTNRKTRRKKMGLSTSRSALARKLVSGPKRRRALPSKEKKCSRCGRWKNTLSGFYKNKRARDGLDYRCKECSHAIRAVWVAENGYKKIGKYTRKDAVKGYRSPAGSSRELYWKAHVETAAQRVRRMDDGKLRMPHNFFIPDYEYPRADSKSPTGKQVKAFLEDAMGLNRRR